MIRTCDKCKSFNEYEELKSKFTGYCEKLGIPKDTIIPSYCPIACPMDGKVRSIPE